MKLHFHPLELLIVICLVLAISVPVISQWFVQYQQSKTDKSYQQIYTNYKIPTSPTPISSKTPIVCPVGAMKGDTSFTLFSDWKVYRDPVYKYQMAYPKDWDISTRESVIIFNSPDAKQDQQKHKEDLQYNTFSGSLQVINPYDSCTLKGYLQSLGSNCTQKINYVKAGVYEAASFLQCDFGQPHVVVWYARGKEYVLTVRREDEFPILLQMLSTFGFQK